MHLVDVHTQQLVTFNTPRTPPYAILSHRWSAQELNFKDVLKGRVDRTTEGYHKLANACRIASECQLDYLWIDTCCIDKRSSAELSEAINSMYSWYEKADICLAHLEDVIDPAATDQSFVESVWFTRSWTLQELIAPKRLVFYSRDWQSIGDKDSKVKLIMSRTGIPQYVLKKSGDLSRYSIAERMSWASDRCATRPEDIAYSLMGIFGVNMPLLYGEGDKAFLRLQEEIIRRASEPTILYWGLNSNGPTLLATSPADFRHVRHQHIKCKQSLTTFNLNNVGLDIEARMARYGLGIYAILFGQIVDDLHTRVCAVLVRKMAFLDAYYRVGVATLSMSLMSRSKKITIFRGTLDQQLLGDFDNGAEYEAHYSIRILSNSLLPILPVDNLVDDFGRDHTEINRDETVTALYSKFCNPSLFESATFKCCPGGIDNLWFEFAFDFESRLCLLVRQDPERIQSYKQRTRPSICDISDAISHGSRDVQLHRLYREVQMCEVKDDLSDKVSYFFRSAGLSCFGQLPTDLTIGVAPVWFAFSHPWWPNNATDSWLLTLSLEAPILLGVT